MGSNATTQTTKPALGQHESIEGTGGNQLPMPHSGGGAFISTNKYDIGVARPEKTHEENWVLNEGSRGGKAGKWDMRQREAFG